MRTVEDGVDILREFMVDPAHSILFSTHVTSDLDSDEVVLLQRLLSPSPEGADGSQDVPV